MQENRRSSNNMLGPISFYIEEERSRQRKPMETEVENRHIITSAAEHIKNHLDDRFREALKTFQIKGNR